MASGEFEREPVASGVAFVGLNYGQVKETLEKQWEENRHLLAGDFTAYKYQKWKEDFCTETIRHLNINWEWRDFDEQKFIVQFYVGLTLKDATKYNIDELVTRPELEERIEKYHPAKTGDNWKRMDIGGSGDIPKS